MFASYLCDDDAMESSNLILKNNIKIPYNGDKIDIENYSTSSLDTVYSELHSAAEGVEEINNDVQGTHTAVTAETKYDVNEYFNEIEDERVACVNDYGSDVACSGSSVDVKKVFAQDEDGDTLLHIALILLSPELAFSFIDGAPSFTWLNIQNKLSQAPLHLAVLTNQVSLVRRLVVAGADIESRDQDGNMPIHLACRENSLNCVQALLQPTRYKEQKRNNYDIPFQSVSRTVNAKNYEGLSCVHIAASGNHLDILKTLLKYGADVNGRAEKSGKTILHEAAWSGNLNLVKFLISLGRQCDINARTYDDYSPFDLARSRGHWSIVMELATAGAKYEDEKDLEI